MSPVCFSHSSSHLFFLILVNSACFSVFSVSTHWIFHLKILTTTVVKGHQNCQKYCQHCNSWQWNLNIFREMVAGPTTADGVFAIAIKKIKLNLREPITSYLSDTNRKCLATATCLLSAFFLKSNPLSNALLCLCSYSSMFVSLFLSLSLSFFMVLSAFN